MKRNSILNFLAIVVCLPSGFWCLPLEEENSGSHDAKFIARGTNEIAKALLQENVNDNGDNMVYSPLGISALLGVFFEGARGASREEIATALYFPKDVEVVRRAYKNILGRFLENNANSPELKTLFYVLKKYTVNQEVLNILKEYYLTEFTYVDDPVERISQVNNVPSPKGTQQKKTQATSQSVSIHETSSQPRPTADQNHKCNSTDASVIKDCLPTAEVAPARQTQNPTEEIQKTAQKDLENSQHAMSPSKITQKKSQSTTKESAKPLETTTTTPTTQKKAMEEAETKSRRNLSHVKATQNDPVIEKVTGTDVEDEPKQGNNVKQEPSIKVAAVFGSPSKEHLSGMTEAAVKVKGETQSHIIIFNGMKYDGEWETPFTKKPAGSSGVFYKSEEEKLFVSTIHSEGYYNTSSIDDLDCRAIELPYKGGKYSLLILLPNARNGLPKLITALSEYPLSEIYHQLTENLVQVSLPTFQISTISKPVSSLKKVGGVQSIKTIFDPDLADFSGISATQSNMFLSEVFQMITFNVDAQYTKTNFLTASIGYSRSNVPTFQVNRPFVFFLRDKSEDLTIVNGKVLDPTSSPCYS